MAAERFAEEARADRFAEDEEAERRLLALLLASALRSLAESGRRAEGAIDWACSPEAWRRFSFERACESVGVEPAHLRRRVGLRVGVPRRRSTRGFLRGPSA